jgi:predicted transposase/invertase (TIGR01784 family)
LLFLKNAGKKGKDGIVKKLRKESEAIDMATKMLEQMSEDERIRQIYFYREKLAMDKASQEAYLRRREEEATKAQEEAAKAREKLKESAIRFIKLGLPIEEIADFTGLSVEEIKCL